MQARALEFLEHGRREDARVGVGRHVQPEPHELDREQFDGGARFGVTVDEDRLGDDLRGGERGPTRPAG